MPEGKIAERQSTAPVPAEGGGWLSVARDAFPRNPYGIVPVTLDLVRAPLATIERLANDPRYSSYWALLIGMTGVTVVALFVTLPRLFNIAVRQEMISVAGEAERLRIKFQFVQLIAVVVATPLQYYAARALSPLPKRPRAYVKLMVLIVSYGMMIRIAFGVVAALVGLGIVFARLPVHPATIIQIEFATATLAGLVVSFAAHRRFWQMAWWKLLILFVIFVPLGMLVISPLVAQAVTAIDRVDAFQVFLRR